MLKGRLMNDYIKEFLGEETVEASEEPGHPAHQKIGESAETTGKKVEAATDRVEVRPQNAKRSFDELLMCFVKRRRNACAERAFH
jgi:hypothetical protein